MVPETAILALEGLTVIEASAAAFTVIGEVVDDSFPEVPVIVAEPTPVPVATPCESIDNTALFDELHVMVSVRSAMLPSL